MANARAHVFVSGTVQGVFFRQKTKREAENHGVTGWIRNLPDERVEAVFEGEEEAVSKLVQYCRHGPPAAHVTDIEVTWETFAAEFNGFETW